MPDLCMCVCVPVCLSIVAWPAWMSLIVPVRPSDNAGGQRVMNPGQGDSDK